jgi:hypothetical protein
MAAIAYPQSHDQLFDGRPALRLVPAARRPSYRRRRVAALLVVALLGIGAWTTVRAAARLLDGDPLNTIGQRGPTEQPVRLPMAPVASRIHVVEPGDTLWSIARDDHPTGDIRALVDQLASGRHGRPLQVGEAVSVP